MKTVKFQLFANPEFIVSFNVLIEKDLPIVTSNKVSKMHEVLAEKNQSYVEVRNEIIRSHAEVDDDGLPIADDDGNVTIKADHVDSINDDFKELLDTEFDLESLSLKELGDISLPARVITSLRTILVD